MEAKCVRDSYTEQVHIVGSGDLNGKARLFGGRLMEWIDMVAGVVARRHAGMNVITASVDSLIFRKAARAGDCVVLLGRVTWVGRTSMEVCVESYVEKLGGEKELINTAYLVMVALDAAEQPAPVPQLHLETEQEAANWHAGEVRSALRRQRLAENF